ncbi:hypothetical protein EX30DRAFT_217939 [Ascodesmis nigricans]|uniref:D-aminoacid aminotransferase-like PLP-dependent enzyme n=1 Tax=Ascodesmis nigricans TaxID=341454 RepID=A0A4S2MZN9_9PEZI|nr:hypothetical protein EX30DRAFT_217939 [Ascodesmis nigricans]
MASNDNSVSIFTSLRYDPILLNSPINTSLSGTNTPCPLYMLTFHSDRLRAAANHFNFSPEAQALCELQSVETRITEELRKYHAESSHSKATPLKVRVEIFNSDPPRAKIGLVEMPKVTLDTLYPEKMPEPNTESKWEAVLDTQPTTKSDFTRYKTNRRAQYDAARERVGIKGYLEPKEVLLWNEEGEVMEASVAAVFVKRKGEWRGMRREAGGLGSTVARWLKESGLVKTEEGEEERVRRTDVKSGDWVVLGNGARGIWGAWVR